MRTFQFNLHVICFTFVSTFCHFETWMENFVLTVLFNFTMLYK